MCGRLSMALIIGSMLLLAAPAAKAEAPIAATQGVVGNQDKQRIALGEVGEQPVFCAATTADDERGLPKALAEKAASRVGAAAGAAAGTALGFVLLGTPGAIIGAACGGVLGEVFFEFFAKQLFRPRPMMPQIPPPLRP
jgi:hypothetical protein